MVSESRNPIKTVFGVLKYSATHKYPENRSALTYSDSHIPSRIDLGKERYGGPFTTEQVEDVKTFLRIVIIVVTLITLIVPLNLCIKTTASLLCHYQSFSSESDCTKSASSVAYSNDVIIVLCILLYELLIYPRARKWVPATLQRCVIASALVVFTSLFLLITDAVAH